MDPMILACQPWVAEWLSLECPIDADGLRWVRTRPARLHPNMVRFPPGCLVRANRTLRIPAPGTVGILASYSEDGGVSVRQDPRRRRRARCRPEWLEVVGYWNGLTPERMRAILAGESD